MKKQPENIEFVPLYEVTDEEYTVYFTEKNSDTGITDLYALDDFAVRKDENIEKGYMLGRYGAIPFLQTEEIV